MFGEIIHNMTLKIIICIISVLLPLTTLLIDPLLNNKDKKPVSYKIIVSLIIVLILCLNIFSIVSDSENEKKSTGRIANLSNNIDTIKKSLLNYGLEVDKDFKAIKLENYYKVSQTNINAKNSVGVNNGQIIDNSQTEIITTQTPQSQKDRQVTNQHFPELENIITPTVHRTDKQLTAKFYVKTKISGDELNNANDAFTVVGINKGNKMNVAVGNTHFNNPGIITNYPTELYYVTENFNSAIDTYYLCIKISYFNSQVNKQVSLISFYRICQSEKNKPIKLTSGSKEHKELIDYLSETGSLGLF